MRRVLAVLRTFLRLAVPYFHSEHRWQARALLAGVVIAEFGVVYALVAFNHWNAYFFNAIQDRNWEAFSFALLLFCGIAAWTALATMAQFFFGQTLIMRWRQWLTDQYVGRWMADGRHYRLRFLDSEPDNAHLRIANDILIFLQKTHDLGYNLLGSLIAFASFAYILWGLSSIAPLTLFGIDVAVPGYLFWIAILYAGTGTLIAHIVGKPLIRLNFNQQRFESDFRFAIARVWDHTEPVALMRGEKIERDVLSSRFSTLVRNWINLIRRQTGLTGVVTTYSQISLVFPILVASPAYFAGAIPLGILMQTALAFQRVDMAFAFILHSYMRIAEWKASMDRIDQLDAALIAVDRPRDPAANIVVAERGGEIDVSDLTVLLPGGAAIASVPRLRLGPGERASVTGASGSGKSSLLRALAGIWPLGEGNVALPADAELLALPQRVYFPLGTLRTVITYPTPSDQIDDGRLQEVMTAVGLDHLAPRLDEEAEWNVVLSGGEQQRIAFARALLRCPTVLLLDEPTSNFDEPTGRELIRTLVQRMPHTSMISFSKAAVLDRFATRAIEIAGAGGQDIGPRAVAAG